MGDWVAACDAPVAGRAVGVLQTDLPVEPGVQERVNQAVATLRALGVRCQHVPLPELAWAVPAYLALSSAECAANLARYDGLRFGTPLPPGPFGEALAQLRA